jgi:hypothetical protein
MNQDLSKQTDLLMDFGLTRLQARVYLALMAEAGRTGYAVAKELDEPAANTYKALESLRQEGLLLADEGARATTFSPQPIELFLDQRERRFVKQRESLEESLRAIVPDRVGDGFYPVESTEQLYALATSLIGDSPDFVAVDATAIPLEQLRPDLERAAQQGRAIFVKTYERADVQGCSLAWWQPMGSPIQRLPIEVVRVVVPGVGLVVGVTDRANVRLLHGVYVRDLYLSIEAYNGVLVEFFLTKALGALAEGGSGKEVLEEWEGMSKFAPSMSTGWHELERSLALLEER